MAPSSEHLDPSDNNAYMIYIPVAVFAVLSPAFVGLRVWSRLRRGGKMGADDYTVITALMFCLASSGVMIASCQYGFGRHFDLIEPADKYETMKYFYICQITYKASINLTKCSILLLYLRIFNKIRWFRWACWFLITCVALYCVASVFATIFQCTPIERSIDKTIDGHCINNAQFWYANAGFSIATDVVILLIPMPLVYQLQIPMVQKIALVIVFTLGGFVVITSCLRITTIDIIAKTTDKTYDAASTMWTIIEPNVAVICASMPMIRPLIVKAFPMFRSKRTYGYGYNSNRYTGPNYGSRSHMTAGSQARDNGELDEVGGAKAEDGIHMASIRRGGSHAGSEDSILGPGLHPADAGNARGIQKTVQYSVEYSAR